MTRYDIEFYSHGSGIYPASTCSCQPATRKGADWLEHNIADQSNPASGFAMEIRYAEDMALGMIADKLKVAVDGFQVKRGRGDYAESLVRA